MVVFIDIGAGSIQMSRLGIAPDGIFHMLQIVRMQHVVLMKDCHKISGSFRDRPVPCIDKPGGPFIEVILDAAAELRCLCDVGGPVL